MKQLTYNDGRRAESQSTTGLLKIGLAAAYVNMSEGWLRKMDRLGKPPYAVRLGTAVRWRRADLDHYIESLAAGRGAE